MPPWKQLERDVIDWLKSFASNEIHFRNSFQAIIGFPSDGFRSDGMLANDDVLLAVEIEAGQMHPDTNVGKYWLLHVEFKSYRKIVLFHIYTPDFNSYGWRLKLGEFYANRMKREVPIQYTLLDYRSRSMAEYVAVLEDIKAKVADAIRREFGDIEMESKYQ